MARIELRDGATRAPALAAKVADRADGASRKSTIKRLAEKYRKSRESLAAQVAAEKAAEDEQEEYNFGLTARDMEMLGIYLESLKDDDTRTAAIANYLTRFRKHEDLVVRTHRLLRRRGIRTSEAERSFIVNAAGAYASRKYGYLPGELDDLSDRLAAAAEKGEKPDLEQEPVDAPKPPDES